jgi:hypoxanthine phosphoribosyltransferase
MSTDATPTIPSLADALANADLLFDRAALEGVIADMGRRIDAALDGERAVFLTVMNGALVFGGHLALAIRTDVEFDYVHATRYRGATTGNELHWLREPQVSLVDRTVLLVDDILDEGHTLKAVRDDCLRRGARRVLVVSLCSKQHDRLVEGIAADRIVDDVGAALLGDRAHAVADALGIVVDDVIGAVRARDLRGRVRGAVVDDEHLHGVHAGDGAGDGLERLRKRRFLVEAGDLDDQLHPRRTVAQGSRGWLA